MKSYLLDRPAQRLQYLYSFILITTVSAGCFGLSELLGYRVVALLLLLAVSLLAIIFDILPVLLAAAMSALIWDFFFIPPRFNIHVDTTEDSILLLLYFVIALINGVLTYKIRQVEKASRLKEERANSVQLYNTILNSLSHELRTPLAAITGAADNLQGNTHLTLMQRQQLVSEISRAALRLNQQVENLLNISRLESGHIKPKNDWCDIVELVYEVVKRVEDNNAGRQIQISINDSMPFCSTDKGILEQVLYNLLNNAALHTQDQSRIEISAACHADLLEFVVEDNGGGFQGIDIRSVFHKFERGKNHRSAGAGLGLSIVKGFTEALGGRVVLERGSFGSTKFTVTLPIKTTALPTYHD